MAKNIFRLTKIGDGRTTEELVLAGNYNYTNHNINSRNFPVRRTTSVSREIVLLEFDREISSEEAIVEAANHGLEQPVYEDALYCGVEHPEVQRERPVVFLHEPCRYPYGPLDVLSLWGYAGDRGLDLLSFGNRWLREYRFAFVRK